MRTRSRLERRVVKLPLIREYVAVRVRGRREVALPDVLPDPRPRRSAKVKQADPTMTKVMRAERRHASCGARASDRGAEAVTTETLEHTPVRGAVVASYERRDDCPAGGNRATSRHRVEREGWLDPTSRIW